MSFQRTARLLAALVLSASLIAGGTPASGAPLAERGAADRARVASAIAALEAARSTSAKVDARAASAARELDAIVQQEALARSRLVARADELYRTGGVSFVLVLFGAQSFQDFATRWDLLTRLGAQSATDLRELRTAHDRTEAAARALMTAQSQQARATDQLQSELASARKALASDQAALAALAASQSRQAPAARRSRAPAPDPRQKLRGSGAWRVAIASNYSPNFHGTGASGKPIGPYTMMVAHRTLPFGTLVEFEYGGKRAVASVEDRGPFTPGRMWDLGPGVVRALGFEGVHPVRYRIIGR